MISEKAEYYLIKAVEEIRNLNKLDGKNLLERLAKCNEEYGEMNAEICKLIGISHKPYDREHLVEESADFLQNAFSVIFEICSSTDIEPEEIFTKMNEKNQKWRKKFPQYTKNQ